MGLNATQVRGDSRTEELQAKNDKEIMPEPFENIEFADANLISIFNVSPYAHKVEHPSVGVLVIPACAEGQKHSEAAIVKGTMPYGVPTDMQTVEIRRDSGRLFALDMLGLGPFRNRQNSLVSQGVFIATGNTLDLNDIIQIPTGKIRGKPQFLNVPRWVRQGKCPAEPTAKELETAQKVFEAHDFNLIKEADGLWDKGPGKEGQESITEMHRQALRRRGQTRVNTWDRPNETLVKCDGCGEMVRPGIRKHPQCGWRFDLKCFESNMQQNAIAQAVEAASKAAAKQTGR